MAGRRGRDLTEGPVFGHLMRLLGPMCLGIFASMTTGLVDAFWLGRLNPENPEELAAVSFVFPVTMAVFSIAIGLGAGTASVVARAAGGGDRERVRRLTTDALVLTLIIVLAVSALGLATIEPLFTAMGASEALMVHIRDYMRIWYLGIVFIVAPLMANNVLRALGDAIAPSIIMVSIAVVNLILDPLLIFGIGPFPRLEVSGAALATLIANLIAFVASAFLIAGREKLIAFSRASWAQIRASWREVARVGIPAAGSNAINPMAMTFVIASVARFGSDTVAGFGAATRVEAMAIIPMFALSASIGPVTGQNSGAGLNDRVREAFVESFKIAAVWGVAIAGVLMLARGFIAEAFTDNEAAQAATRLYLLIVPLSAIGYGVIMAASAGFNGLGKPLPGLTMTVCRALLLLAPAAWIGGNVGGLKGALIGIAIANVISGALAVSWVLGLSAPGRRSALTGG